MRKQKQLQKITIGFLSLVLMSLFAMVTSCKDDDYEVEQEITHKWYYKVEASAGSTITNILHDNHFAHGMEENVSITGINGTTWTSGEFGETTKAVPGKHSSRIPMYIKAKANGKDVYSTLKVQIYVDGVLWKETKDIGQTLNAEANYEYIFK